MKTLEEQKKESDEKIRRFWECFDAIRKTDSRISGKLAYAEAKLQLGYSPPFSRANGRRMNKPVEVESIALNF